MARQEAVRGGSSPCSASYALNDHAMTAMVCHYEGILGVPWSLWAGNRLMRAELVRG